MEQNFRVVKGKKSFSQAHQDLFVVAMTGEKRSGSYVELGAGHPFQNSNTALLELDYGWEGVSWELDSDLHRLFVINRLNRCLGEDVFSFDFRFFFESTFSQRQIDYLSLDVDDNLRLLQILPFDCYRFSVITFEHDSYRNGPEDMLKSRIFFEGLGYKRVVSNVLTQGRDFEDWYVDPEVVPESLFSKYVGNRVEAVDIFDSLEAL